MRARVTGRVLEIKPNGTPLIEAKPTVQTQPKPQAKAAVKAPAAASH